MSIESHAYLGGLLITSIMNQPELGIDTVSLDGDFPYTAQVGMDGVVVVVQPDGNQAGIYRVKEETDRSWTITQGTAHGNRLVVRTDSRLTAVGALLASF